jgi:beta-galactosidase
VRHLVWRLAYAPGTLRAVARKNGRVWATAEVTTAGAPARVALTPDRATIRADGSDLSFVTVTVLDSTGVAVPTAEHLMHLQLTGDARIAGVDNGDETSHEAFQADHVKLFSGKALVIIRGGRTPGPITLTATADGLAPASTRIELQPR